VVTPILLRFKGKRTMYANLAARSHALAMSLAAVAALSIGAHASA